MLDPGHNGGNASHPAEINALVPAGRGQTKPCNTTGTATNAGYTEHAFNWDVANRVEDRPAGQGHHRRADPARRTPASAHASNERAAIGNNANAAAVVSIHADGSEPPARTASTSSTPAHR